MARQGRMRPRLARRCRLLRVISAVVLFTLGALCLPIFVRVGYGPWVDVNAGRGIVSAIYTSGTRNVAHIRVEFGLPYARWSPNHWFGRIYCRGGMVMIGMSLWLPLFIACAATIIVFVKTRQLQTLRCHQCGYSTIGNITGRCSECGFPVESVCLGGKCGG